MQADITALRARLDEIDKRDKEYKEQVVRLRKVLDEATALLTRNSADVGAKAAKAEQDIAALQGRIEEMAHGVELAEPPGRRRAEPARDPPGGAGADADQDRRQGRARRCPTTRSSSGRRPASGSRPGQRDDGRRFYRVFIQRFPQDPRASQAYLAIGMSFVQESKYPNAAAEFQKVLNVYPSSPEVPEAMWQLSLRSCSSISAPTRGRCSPTSSSAYPKSSAPPTPRRAQDDRQAPQVGLHELAARRRSAPQGGGATWRPAAVGIGGAVDGGDDRGRGWRRPARRSRPSSSVMPPIATTGTVTVRQTSASAAEPDGRVGVELAARCRRPGRSRCSRRRRSAAASGLREVVRREPDHEVGPAGARRERDSASASGRSSWPRWTTSAPTARATSSRSLTQKGTPASRQSGSRRRAARSSARAAPSPPWRAAAGSRGRRPAAAGRASLERLAGRRARAAAASRIA